METKKLKINIIKKSIKKGDLVYKNLKCGTTNSKRYHEC